MYGSICSGICAATAAWRPLGWHPKFFSEIEAFPSAVLAHHYPEVPNLGNFTAIDESAGPIDLLVGGTPCQAFSIAGLRKGLDDARGNLTLEFLRLAGRLRPRWVVWENVPGVLSIDGGRTFGTFLGGLGQLGYGFAYRILDAQHFGVPQRRRRVFVVGYLGDWRRAAAVLFERHSLQGHPAPRRQARQDTAPTLSARTRGGGGLGTDFDCDGGLICPTLRAGGNRTGGDRPPGTDVDTVESLIVAHSLRAEDFDSSEDGTGRGTPLAPIGFCNTAGNTNLGVTEDGMPPLTRRNGDPGMVAFAIQERAVCENSDAGPDGIGVRSDGAAYTLEARTVPQAVALAIRGRDGVPQIEMGDEVANALLTPNGGRGGIGVGATLYGSAVRRITPTEAERLQGFEDGYTAIPYRGKLAADGPRYKALGNSMAVPVMRWIGERIEAVEKL